MATKPLKTLTFEGLNDTYTVPQVDATLAVTGDAADAKATGDALATKADKIGNIALAERLYGGEYTSESEPYHFRQAPDGMGSKSETIVGGSLAWNQLVQNGNFESASGWTASFSSLSVSNNEATLVSDKTNLVGSEMYRTDMNFSANRVCVVSCMVKTSNTPYFRVRYPVQSQNVSLSNDGQYHPYAIIVKTGTSGLTGFGLRAIKNNASDESTVSYKGIKVIDLTTCFGSTIADYIYSLETATAGAGVAWVKRYIDLDTYHEYDAGSIQSVEGLESHNTYDEDENLLASYPLDSSVTLRGVPKLVTDHIEFDGDKYRSDGTLERRYGERAYQSGDESLADAITDGTTTVYKLTTPTTETAQPFQSPMIVGATEEYISDSVVPVGHESKYYEDVAKKVSGLPKDFSTLIAPVEVTFTATRNYSVGSYLIVKNQLYKVASAISSGGTITPNSNVTATTIMAEILALA